MADGLDFSFRITIFPDVIKRLTDDPTSPGARAGRETADAIHKAAIPLIGTKYSGTTGKPKEPRSSRLKDSGEVRQERNGWVVVFDHPIAAAHHQGTPEHDYPARKAVYSNRHPKTWKNATKRFHKYGPFTHPGTDANPFLVEASEQVGVRGSGALKRGTAGPFPVFRSKGFF